MEKIISVIGESKASPLTYQWAETVGYLLAEAKIIVACGGLAGVMEAVCKGAKSAGGITIGILPGNSRLESNNYIDIPIVTGIGYARNSIVAKTGQVAIAIGGWFGTLCEIAYALDSKVPVIGLGTWHIEKKGKILDPNIILVQTPKEAVQKALDLLDLL